MVNKNPASRVVNIPSRFMPQVEQEREQMGCFTTCECMGRILDDYFGRKAQNPSNIEKKEDVIKGKKEDVIKGVKVSDN